MMSVNWKRNSTSKDFEIKNLGAWWAIDKRLRKKSKPGENEEDPSDFG